MYQQVLIIGGGDGGVVREVTKHPEVTEIHLCEIDEVIKPMIRLFSPYTDLAILENEQETFYCRVFFKELQFCFKFRQ